MDLQEYGRTKFSSCLDASQHERTLCLQHATYARTHARTHTRTHVRTHARTHVHIHTYTHTYIHTYTHTLTHAHTHPLQVKAKARTQYTYARINTRMYHAHT